MCTDKFLALERKSRRGPVAGTQLRRVFSSTPIAVYREHSAGKRDGNSERENKKERSEQIGWQKKRKRERERERERGRKRETSKEKKKDRNKRNRGVRRYFAVDAVGSIA